MWHWLYFFSMFSWIDRACGYLSFVPFTSIIVLTYNSLLMPEFDTQLLHLKSVKTVQSTPYETLQKFTLSQKLYHIRLNDC